MDDPPAHDIFLTESELTLLATVTEDGFPMRGLAATLTAEQVDELKADATRLLSHGLVCVYTDSAEDFGDVPEKQAQAILLSSANWLGSGDGSAWFIATTPRGDALLAARGLGALRRNKDR